jgi:DNA-binding transcriptional LysR family regulator
VIGPARGTQIVTFDPVLWTSDFNILLEAACSGTGLALLPAQVVERAVSEQRLVRHLPDWHSESVTIYLVFMTKRSLASAVRVFIDYIAAQFKVIWEEAS